MKESQKALEKLSLAFTTTSFAGKSPQLAGKCTQAVGRNWKRKGSWENAKEMLEMEEQHEKSQEKSHLSFTRR